MLPHSAWRRGARHANPNVLGTNDDNPGMYFARRFPPIQPNVLAAIGKIATLRLGPGVD
jgi:hypothetical protein